MSPSHALIILSVTLEPTTFVIRCIGDVVRNQYHITRHIHDDTQLFVFDPKAPRLISEASIDELVVNLRTIPDTEMYNVTLVQSGTNVVVSPIHGTTITKAIIDYLDVSYNSMHLGDPYNLCIVPKITLFSLASDAKLSDLALSPATILPVQEQTREQSQPPIQLSDRDLEYLAEELAKTKTREREYYKTKIDDFQEGDRVTYQQKNYTVIEATPKTHVIQHVTMLGYAIKPTVTKKIVLNYYAPSSRSKKWYWTEERPESPYLHSVEYPKLQRGVLLYDEGPEITSVDSPYLRYKTLRPSMQLEAKPEVGMFVSLGKHSISRRYVIEDIEGSKLHLRRMNPEPTHEFDWPTILVVQPIEGSKWHVDKIPGDFYITMGSWRENYSI